jgi:uncharacterized protein (DUF1697 family)
MATRYVALLRGINVGGNNLIKMSDLKACFESAGFQDVSTFIASGNVLFEAEMKKGPQLAARIEKLLSERFGYASRVVLRSKAQLWGVVKGRPKGFGDKPAKYRYDVLFVREPATAAQVLEVLKPKEGVDTAAAGEGVVYASRLVAKAAQSRLYRVVSSPIYQDVTIRNWNTTQRLAALL